MAILAIADRSNENVSLTARGDFVVATWSASTGDSTDIYAAESVDGGISWGAPVQVNSTPGEARVGGEQPPRVTLLPPRPNHDSDVVVVWTARGPAGARLLMARSSDGGRTFRKTEVVPGGPAKGNRGWESLATSGSGKAVAFWVDNRDESELWFGSLDGAIRARAITGNVCHSGKTSIATAGENVYGVWRHVFDGNQRDIAFTMSRDGGTTFSQVRRVSAEQWLPDSCPEDGPAIAVEDDGAIYVAWVAPEDGRKGAPLALFYSWSRDGIHFESRRQMKTGGAAGHVQLAPRAEGGVAIAWDEATPKGRRVRVALEGKASRFPPPMEGDGLYPALAKSSAGTVVAWTTRGAPKSAIAFTVLP